MSEYQYYAFQALDRRLGEAEREALRVLSTRARITATSFTNHYEWGDFKGDPRRLMERCFDLHLYLANWGTRRLMMRLPKRLLEVPCPSGTAKGVVNELDVMLPEYYEYRGWDQDGIPTTQTLQRLGLIEEGKRLGG